MYLYIQSSLTHVALLLTVVRLVPNIAHDTRQKHLYHVAVDNSAISVFLLPPVLLHESIKWQVANGERVAVFTSEKHNSNNNNQRQQQISQIYQGRTIQLSHKLHSKIVFEPDGLGTPQWRADGQYLVYTAKRPALEYMSFFPFDDRNNNDGNNNTTFRIG